TIIQNGDTAGAISLPFFVDAAAPLNTNESHPWHAIHGMNTPCADGIDTDLDYRTDCASPLCIGAVGRIPDGAICEAQETTCWDGFDNNGNGFADCADPHCHGRVGDTVGGALCSYGTESGAACFDGFDNDGNG